MSTRAVSWTARAAVVLCVFCLAACSGSGGNAAKNQADEARIADFTPPPAPDIPAEPGFADDPLDPAPRSDFEFSSPRGAGRVPALEPRPERPDPAGARAAAANKPRPRRGNEILVVWEALAREKQLLEDSRFKRRGPQPPQKITLINSSHPDARKFTTGRGAQSHGHTAVLSDRDMTAFLKGLEQRGFYRYARPMGNASASRASENSRGLITITRNGSSRTLISMRGQGQNPQTRAIPRIYSETKQAIMVLKNMSPTLNVSHVGAEPMRR